ncbi:MAG: aldose 1-epimerase [Burkholderiales bacterium]|jgi:aldose 1-epimerase|nr:aldose 1-epimerase [Burkholderiales bacterium]
MTQQSEAVFELHAGALRLALRPDLGGCIAGLWHRETAVLRSSDPTHLDSARGAACYPLVPYSNRLAYRRFRWKGRDYTTAPNFDASPHSVHGVGWLRAWQVTASSAVDVGLRYRHEADAHWPFDFEVSQHFTLAPSSLRVQLQFTNTADIAQPVGLGWHPYFPKRARSRLHVELSDRWDSDAAQLPVRKHAQPGIDGDIAHLDFDNCFEGWAGPARIRDEKMALQLTASMQRLVVYTPRDKDYFCVEPVSHVSNAIHMAEPTAQGLQVVQPDETVQAWMQLDITMV